MNPPKLKEIFHKIVEIHHTDSEFVAVPILVKLLKGGQSLWLVGTRHTRDAIDPQIPELEKTFAAWIKETGGGKVCLEWRPPGPALDEGLPLADAVAKVGESAVFAVLGRQAGLPVAGIEPGFDEVTRWALEVMPDPQAFAAWSLLNLLATLANPDGTLGDSALPTLASVLPKIGARYGLGDDAAAVYGAIAKYVASRGIAAVPRSLDGLKTEKLDVAAIKAAQVAADGPHDTNRAAVAMNLARDYGLLRNTLTVTEDGRPAIVWTCINHLLSQLPAFEFLGYEKALPGRYGQGGARIAT